MRRANRNRNALSTSTPTDSRHGKQPEPALAAPTRQRRRLPGPFRLLLALLLGLAAAWRRLEAAREGRSQARFSQAVEQLASERSDGSPRTETRLGGIYALERIAAESDQEYWPVMEVLTAYLRENAAWKH